MPVKLQFSDLHSRLKRLLKETNRGAVLKWANMSSAIESFMSVLLVLHLKQYLHGFQNADTLLFVFITADLRNDWKTSKGIHGRLITWHLRANMTHYQVSIYLCTFFSLQRGFTNKYTSINIITITQNNNDVTAYDWRVNVEQLMYTGK